MRIFCLMFTMLSLCSCALKPTIPDGESIYTKNKLPSGGELIYNLEGDKKVISYRRRKTLERMASICHPNLFKVTSETDTSTEKSKRKRKLFGQKVRLIKFKCHSI